MKMECIRCQAAFEGDVFRGYCEECLEHFEGIAEKVSERQNPGPGVHVTGKFTTEASPQTVVSAITGHKVCGICGSHELEEMYCITAYGWGAHQACWNCGAILDFQEEDTG